MRLWLDAQLSPKMATWIAERIGIEATAVRDIGLRDSSDLEIFQAAKRADAILITKDSDFRI